MIQTLKKHWPSVLAVALQLNAVVGLVTSALDWRSRYDAFTETLTEVGGVSAVIGYVLNPPSWFYPAAFVVGLLLIYWDFWRRVPAVSASPASQPAPIATVSTLEPPAIVFGENGSHETKIANRAESVCTTAMRT